MFVYADGDIALKDYPEPPGVTRSLGKLLVQVILRKVGKGDFIVMFGIGRDQLLHGIGRSAAVCAPFRGIGSTVKVPGKTESRVRGQPVGVLLMKSLEIAG